jgi:hypothetical protein
MIAKNNVTAVALNHGVRRDEILEHLSLRGN